MEELDTLFELAMDIEKNPEKYADRCAGKKIATCFYEASTRTRLVGRKGTVPLITGAAFDNGYGD